MELSESSGFMFAIVTECVMDIDAFFPIMGRRKDLKFREGLVRKASSAWNYDDLVAIRSGMESKGR
jgi:hypothetical protein